MQNVQLLTAGKSGKRLGPTAFAGPEFGNATLLNQMTGYWLCLIPGLGRLVPH